MRQLHLDRVDAERAEGSGELAETFGVRSVAAADRERIVVEPQQIATLGGGLALESGKRRR